MTAPTQVMINALKTGSILTNRFSARRDPPKALPTYKNANPTAVKVAASPKLNATVKTNP